jgi:2-oxoglutarate ferredoxin oxidoreductase subunit delta
MTRGTLIIDTERCKACGLCISVCPQHLLHPSPGLNRRGYHPVELLSPDDTEVQSGGCTGCALCALICPDVAITVLREPSSARSRVRAPERNGHAPAPRERMPA